MKWTVTVRASSAWFCWSYWRNSSWQLLQTPSSRCQSSWRAATDLRQSHCGAPRQFFTWNRQLWNASVIEAALITQRVWTILCVLSPCREGPQMGLKRSGQIWFPEAFLRNPEDHQAHWGAIRSLIGANSWFSADFLRPVGIVVTHTSFTSGCNCRQAGIALTSVLHCALHAALHRLSANTTTTARGVCQVSHTRVKDVHCICTLIYFIWRGDTMQIRCVSRRKLFQCRKPNAASVTDGLLHTSFWQQSRWKMSPSGGREHCFQNSRVFFLSRGMFVMINSVCPSSKLLTQKWGNKDALCSSSSLKPPLWHLLQARPAQVLL